MSYLPDTTLKYQLNIYGKEEDGVKIPNGYYEKLLPKDCQNQLLDIDLTIQEAVDNFFANLDIYADAFSEAGIDVSKIDSESVISNDLTDEEIENLDKETRKIGTIRDCLQDYLAMYRNECIISMIDNIPDDENDPAHKEYVENYKKIFGKSPDEGSSTYIYRSENKQATT